MEFADRAQDYPEEAVAASKAVVSSLVLTLKILSLYPEDHVHCQTAMARLQKDLETFFSKYEKLTIDVGKNRLLFAGKVVYQGISKEGDLSFALFRDGILNLVLRRGIESREVAELAKILAKYKAIPAEPEGDIVTALWEAQLPHLQYEAVEHILDDPEAGITSLGKNNGQLPQLTQRKERTASTYMEIHEHAESLHETKTETKDLPGIDIPSLQLTDEELKRLQEMVCSEEEGNARHDILNMMADIVDTQQNDEFIEGALGYMKEEIHIVLSRKDFDVPIQILKSLYQVWKLSKESRPWLFSRVSKFFLKISERDFLAPLQDVWPTMNALELEKLKKVLLLLPSRVIGALGPMMPEAPSYSIRRMLSDVIVSLASRSFKPFEKLLDAAGEDLMHDLVRLLGRLADERSAQILVNMAHHPLERIRMEALRAIVVRGLWVPEPLMFLMNDKSDSIRRILMDYLGSRRSEAAEGLLLNYLQNKRLRSKDRAQVIACIKTLGRCGTEGSLAFLENVLLRSGWISRFCSSALRKGAAMALTGLETEKAKQVLNKASRSFYPGIRGAAQEVMQMQRG